MKKLLILAAVALPAFGAGTVQQTVSQLGSTNNWVVAFRWTGDSASGSVPITAAVLRDDKNQICCQGYLITQVETVPSSPAPTSGYSVAIKDAAGVDALDGAAASLSSTTAQSFAAAASAPPVQGTFSLVITGQSVAGAQGIVYVFLAKPGTVNVAKLGGSGGGSSSNWLTIANPPFADARRYNFAAQTPGGILSAGANTIRMAPCPDGVNGTDTAHYLYVSGGIGTAERALITGGTCTSGAVSGTLVVTVAGNHSGLWKIQSATGGGGEAQQAIISSGGYGIVQFVVPVVFHAGIYATASSNRLLFAGVGRETNLVSRAQDYTAGDLFRNDVGASWAMRELGIVNGLPTPGATAGAAVYVGPGQIQMENVGIVNGQFGVRLVGAVSTTLDNVTYINVDMSFKAAAGLSIEHLCTNVFVNNSMFVGAPVSNANVVASGMRIWSVDGLWVENTLMSGDVAIAVNPQSDYITNVHITGGGVDSARSYALLFTGAGFPVHDIYVANIHLNSQSDGATYGLSPVVYVDPSISIDNVSFVGGQIAFGGTEGVLVLATGMRNFSFSGVTISDNNKTNTAAKAGVSIGNGVTGVHITDCTSGNLLGLGHQKYGILTSGTADATLVGNDLRNNETAPVVLSPGFSGILANNRGLDLLSGAGSALSVSGNAIAPTHDIHHVGAGLIKNITVPSGFLTGCVNLIPDAAFTTDATGNVSRASTAIVGQTMQACYDGTKWNLSY